MKLGGDFQPLSVCDRNADVGSTEDFATLQQYAQCPEITPEKPILLLEGLQHHGRTGNNLIEVSLIIKAQSIYCSESSTQDVLKYNYFAHS